MDIQSEIESRLAEREPDVEVLRAELVGDTVELFIDHPDGVSLGLCERVTYSLGEIRERHALTVSSPGPRRPLTKPQHFRRFVGRRARVRTLSARDAGPAAGDRRPVRSFTGELVGASDDTVTIAAPTGVVSIPYAEISRSNLVEE